jgi:hypothetical protein
MSSSFYPSSHSSSFHSSSTHSSDTIVVLVEPVLYVGSTVSVSWVSLSTLMELTLSSSVLID